MEKSNIAYWEQLLRNLPESYRIWFEHEKIFLKKYVKRNARVLEVGCGDGRSLYDILSITNNIVGIDHDPQAIENAKMRFKDFLKTILSVAEAEHLPFENDSFDVVTCMGTFANFGEKKFVILEEMKRVLKKDGNIIISVFSENALEERKKVYELLSKDMIKEIREDGTVLFNWKSSDNISEQFSKEKLVEIFKTAKLKVEVIEKAEIAYLCKLSK